MSSGCNVCGKVYNESENHPNRYTCTVPPKKTQYWAPSFAELRMSAASNCTCRKKEPNCNQADSSHQTTRKRLAAAQANNSPVLPQDASLYQAGKVGTAIRSKGDSIYTVNPQKDSN